MRHLSSGSNFERQSAQISHIVPTNTAAQEANARRKDIDLLVASSAFYELRTLPLPCVGGHNEISLAPSIMGRSSAYTGPTMLPLVRSSFNRNERTTTDSLYYEHHPYTHIYVNAHIKRQHICVLCICDLMFTSLCIYVCSFLILSFMLHLRWGYVTLVNF